MIACLGVFLVPSGAFKMFRAKWLHLWGIKNHYCSSIKVAQNESVKHAYLVIVAVCRNGAHCIKNIPSITTASGDHPVSISLLIKVTILHNVHARTWVACAVHCLLHTLVNAHAYHRFTLNTR